jgi:hypothetical protein
MQPIVPEAVQAGLQSFVDQTVYIHLETNMGAYAEGSFGLANPRSSGAFIRNAAIRFARAVLAGTGPYRVGLQMDHGWVYCDGLTDWELDGQGRLLLAGHDKEGRLMVALELSLTPFPA